MEYIIERFPMGVWMLFFVTGLEIPRDGLGFGKLELLTCLTFAYVVVQVLSELLNLSDLLGLYELLDLPSVEKSDIFYLLYLGFAPIGLSRDEPPQSEGKEDADDGHRITFGFNGVRSGL